MKWSNTKESNPKFSCCIAAAREKMFRVKLRERSPERERERQQREKRGGCSVVVLDCSWCGCEWCWERKRSGGDWRGDDFQEREGEYVVVGWWWLLRYSFFLHCVPHLVLVSISIIILLYRDFVFVFLVDAS